MIVPERRFTFKTCLPQNDVGVLTKNALRSLPNFLPNRQPLMAWNTIVGKFLQFAALNITRFDISQKLQ